MDIVWLSLLGAGLITGFSKFSIGGMGLLILPIVMLTFPGPEALGVIIPMYIITDLMAISSYRKSIAWPTIFRIAPIALLGILIGGLILKDINAGQFSVMLGVIIVGIIALGYFLDNLPSSFMQHPYAAYITGLLTGIISLIANAAGPLFSLFLIEQRLSKDAYVSTRAWAFLLINITKVPVLYSLNLLNIETITASLQCLPGLALGAFIGYHLLNHLNLKQFKRLIRIMATIAAIKLILFT
jgi:uncharacterized membrane protein YfcA